MLKSLIAATLFAACSLADAAQFTIVTGKGYVRFAVPDQWQLLAMDTKPPVSVAAFQVGNAADSGTPHSTNVAVSLFHIETERGLSTEKTVGKAFGAMAPAVSNREGWTIYTQEAYQDGTLYTVIDAKRPLADVVVAVRFAWPHLRANPSGYDESMSLAFDTLRRSVEAGFGPPKARPGEVVRRPVQ